MSDDISCPLCQGNGLVIVGTVSGEKVIPCGECLGHGTMSSTRADWLERGNEHRIARIERGETLRECARRYGISDRHLANMEHARTAPEFPS